MRREYKYLVPNNQLDNIRRSISPFCTLDSHTPDGKNHYTISSVYLDSSSSSSYVEKIEGIGQRRKLRVRVYNPQEYSNTVFLEIKRKREQYIAKTRFKMRREQLPDILNNDIPSTRAPQLSSFLYY
ncbi:MAG: VTC domain-containing protein, partial [Calditrichota bacterium]